METRAEKNGREFLEKIELMKQDENYQQEYEERELIFVTDFKNGAWCKDSGSRFDADYLKCTRKEYDEMTEFYYNDESNGKIIGGYTFESLEEFRASRTVIRNDIRKIMYKDNFNRIDREEKRRLKGGLRI